jgi:hypothetical protein
MPQFTAFVASSLTVVGAPFYHRDAQIKASFPTRKSANRSPKAGGQVQ